MSSQRIPLVAVAVALLFTATVSLGDVPKTMNYQGQLLDSEGQPVTDTMSMTFAIYDDPVSGNQLWIETHPSVSVEAGLFSEVLGCIIAIPDSAFATDQTWLEIVVEGETIEPRTALTAMPYTFSASSVKGDFTTEPGGITLEDAAKGGGYVRLKAHATGNEASMYMVAPSDQGVFAMYDWQGGTPQPMVEVTASRDLGNSILLVDPIDQRDLLEISTNFETGATIRLINPQPEPPAASSLEILYDVIAFEGACGTRADMRTEYSRCGMAMNDTSGETLMVANETGFYCQSTGGRESEIWIKPSHFQLGNGNFTGNVGFGAVAPNHRLVVGKDLGWSAGEFVVIGNDFAASYSGLKIGEDEANHGRLLWHNDSDYVHVVIKDDDISYYPIYFKKDKVGIGQADPFEDLVIGLNVGPDYPGKRITIGDQTGGAKPGLVIGEDDNNKTWMIWDVDSNQLEFGNKVSGSVYAEVVVIKRNNVGVLNGIPSYPLDVGGDIRCVSVIETSDSRLKSNVRELEGALDKLEQINGVTFEWNDLSESHGGTAGKRDIGVIADEVESVFPELVYADNEGYKSVAYTKIVPVLIEAVKDQQKTIDELSSQVEELRAFVQKLVEDK